MNEYKTLSKYELTRLTKRYPRCPLTKTPGTSQDIVHFRESQTMGNWTRGAIWRVKEKHFGCSGMLPDLGRHSTNPYPGYPNWGPSFCTSKVYLDNATIKEVSLGPFV